MGRKKDEVVYVPSKEAMCPDWMLTMGDAMSLLLTFFVLLLTFSTMDEHQLMSVMGFVQGALGAVKIESIKEVGAGSGERGAQNVELVDQGSAEANVISGDDVSSVMLASVEIQGRFYEMERKLSALGMKNVVNVDILENGVRFTLSPEVLFQESGGLAAAAAYVLQGIVNLAADVNNELRLIACVAPESVSSPRSEGSAWAEALRCSSAVGDLLVSDFNVPASRLAHAARVLNPGEPARFEIMLMEKMGVQEISLRELWESAGPGRSGGE